MSEPVLLSPYDSAWPQRFAEEQALLAGIFEGTGALVEHVGSTAVPGLGAKPIIDIVVGLDSLHEIEVRIPALEEQRYQYVPEYEAQLPERRFLRKPASGHAAFHLHGVRCGGSFWVRHLAFRDHLRTHPGAASAYSDLKQELASRYRDDRAAYTKGKSAFVESILEEAGVGQETSAT